MKTEKKQKIINFWPKLWNLLAFVRRQIYFLLFFIVLIESLKLIGPYILKNIIDKLISFQAEELKNIVFLIILMFASEQSTAIINLFKDRRIFKILIDIEYELLVMAQKKLVSLPLDYHERENTGSKLAKIERGIFKISELLGNISFEVAPTLIQLFMTLAVLFIVDWRFGILFLFFAPIFIILTYHANIKLYPVRKQRQRDYEKASGKLGQAIININAVKSFVQEEREAKEYGIIKEKIRINEIKEWFSLCNSNLSRSLTIDFGRISILLLGSYLVWQNMVSIGTLVFVITLSEKSFFSLFRLSRFYDRIGEGSEAVDRFINIINEKIDIVSPENGLKPKRVIGRIEFENVSFKYGNGRERALSNVSLSINSGCITALIGPSGGGKTTVARMIYRHYDPQKGKVRLDNEDLKKYDLFHLRKSIAIVPQEVEIFDLPVKENIAYAKPNASMKEIAAAARIANAEEFIEKLPQKYDTAVGERGIKLSGGQRQRIGIARAILANPRILIFDEATSNLDSYSEKLIQESMDKISKDRTTIIIAHRLSTIKKADKIIVLENGRVVEEGNHIELSRAQGGLYAKLLNLQRMGDVE